MFLHARSNFQNVNDIYFCAILLVKQERGLCHDNKRRNREDSGEYDRSFFT